MQNKKILSLLLALLMVFTTVVGATATDINERVYEKTDEQSLVTIYDADNDFIKSTSGLYEDEDEVEIIVVLNPERNIGTRSFSNYEMNSNHSSGLRSVKGFDQFYGRYLNDTRSARSLMPQSRLNPRDSKGVLDTIDYNINSQINTLNQLLNLGYNFEIIMSIDYVLNSYALKTDYKTAKAISELNFVDAVYINRHFAPIEPNMNTSNDLIHSPYAWDAGFDGAGMLVAVIDSGTDYNHPDFQNIDITKARIKSEEELKAIMDEKGINHGKWFTNKIPFGFNYVKNDDVINEDVNNPKISMHGQHVAGTVLANGKLKGVAPNAQLLAMRVFSEGAGTSEIYYMPAINDAVKLGVDAINMSLGSPLGASKSLRKDSVLDKTLKAAIESGAVISISAGNDGQFGGLNAKVRSDNPDYGVTGAPSAYEYSISVAAAGNTSQKLPYITVNGKNYPYSPTKTSEGVFDKTFEVVNVGKGIIDDQKGINDYEGKEVKGKAVLIERGGSTFVSKINTAEAQGATVAIIYNHEEGGNKFIGMVIDGTKLPSMSILRDDVLKIKDGESITINNTDKIDLYPAPTAGDMGDFSSWGPTIDFEFKPEIAAPGVDIYSTLYEGKYGNMNGTSMAAPHIAGAATIIKQRLMKDFPDFRGKDLSILIKNMLMSTANPITDKVTNSIISPRKQGAGMVNNMAAVRSNAYLYDPVSGLAKINLKSNANNKPFTVAIKNLGDKNLEYNTKLVVMTNDVKDGKFTLREKTLYEKEFGKVTVNANSVSENEYQINIDQNTREALMNEMPNGYWIDAYLFYTSDDKDVPELSIPIIGFSEDYDEIPIFEKSIYDMDVKNGDVPTYYDGKDDAKTSSINSTYLYSFIGESWTVLGFNKGANFVNLDTRKDKIAFSPNGDGYFDELRARFVANRNFKNAILTLYTTDENGNAKEMVSHDDAGTWRFASSGNKNAYMDRDKFPKSYAPRTGFVVKPTDKVVDGNYIVRLSASPQYADNVQNLDFPVIIDREMPRVPKVVFDESTRIAKVYITDNIGEIKGSGIKYAYYTNKSDKADRSKRTNVEVDDSTEFIDIKIPEDKKLEDIVLVLQDWAGNKIEDDLLNFMEQVSYGKIVVNTVVKDSTESVGDVEYEIIDSNGEKIDNINRVKVGEYTFNVKNVPVGYKLVSEKSFKVQITEDELVKTVTLTLEKIVGKKISVQISVDEKIKKELDAKVKAVDNQGNEYVFVPGTSLSYGGNKNYYYDFILPYGEDYKITITDNKNEFKIEPNEFNIKSLNENSRSYLMAKAYPSDIKAKSLIIKSTGLADGVEVLYNVYDSSFNIVKDITKLLPGKYYVEVDKVPAGYMVDSTEKEVSIVDKDEEVVFNFTDVSNTKSSITFNIVNNDNIEFDENDIVVEDANGNIIEHSKLNDLRYGQYNIYLPTIYSTSKYKGYGLFNSVNSQSTKITLNKELENAVLELKLERLNKSGEKLRLNIGHRDESFSDRYDRKEKLIIELVNVDGEKFEYSLTFSGFESMEVPKDYYEFNIKQIADKFDGYFKYNDKPSKGAVVSGFYPTLDVYTKLKDAPGSGLGSINLEFKDVDGNLIDGVKFKVTNADDKSFEATTLDELKQLKLGTYTITIVEVPEGYKMPARKSKVALLDNNFRTRNVSFILEKSEENPVVPEPNPTGEGKVKLNNVSYNDNLDLKDLYIVRKGSTEKIRPKKIGSGYLSYYGFENLKLGKYEFGVDNNCEIAIAVENKEFEILNSEEKTINILAPNRFDKYTVTVDGLENKDVLKFKHYTKDYKNNEFEILTEGIASNSVKVVLDKNSIPQGKVLSSPKDGILDQRLFLNSDFRFVFIDEGAEETGESAIQISYTWANAGISGMNMPFIPKYKVTKDSLTGKEFFGDNRSIYKNLPEGKYFIQITNIPDGWTTNENPVVISLDGKAPRFNIPQRVQIRYYNPNLAPANDGVINVSLSDFNYNGDIKFELKDDSGEIVEVPLVRSQYMASYSARNIAFGKYTLSITAPGHHFDKDVYEFEIKPLDNIVYIRAKIEKGEPEPKPIEYTITFNYNDGTGNKEVVKVKAGEKIKAINDPVREGYEFKGWFNGEAKFNFDEVINADIVLTAKWELIPVEPAHDKKALAIAVDESRIITKTAKYIYADENLKANYDTKLEEARKVLANEKATQKQVDKALEELLKASEELNGANAQVNKTELLGLVNEAKEIKEDIRYKAANERRRKQYDTALENAKKVLENKDATRNEVLTAENMMLYARQELYVYQPLTRKELEKLAFEVGIVKIKAEYRNSKQEQKKAYDEAIKKGQKLLFKIRPTEEEIARTVIEIRNAKEELNGDKSYHKKQTLTQLVFEVGIVKLSLEYKNATEETREKYNEAISEGTKVLFNMYSTRAEVIKAVQDIVIAKQNLNGLDFIK